ncbi:phosphotransferase [Rhodobacteraceae bacterium KMM 6894]|nr:phosphotransferase [Rhodobacteraceae bacterium KMM 6894]
MQDKPPPIPDLDVMLDISSAFEAIRRTDPGLANAELGDLIRHIPGKRAIFHGALNGSDVVFRLHFNAQDSVAQREWDEILRLWPYMAEGDLRIAKPIHANIDAGLIVQERIIGTPMLEYFRGIDSDARGPCLTAAAAWLRQSTVMSEGWRVPNPKGWIKRAAQASHTQPFPQLKTLENQILAQMRRLAPVVASQTWRAAISHGDYHPNNLIVNGPRLTGIDLGGSKGLPVCKDMARFLMHMGRRRVTLPGPLAFGVSRMGLDAFSAAFDLSAHERSVVLPFFLAFEALIRVENTGLAPSRIRRAEKMYLSLLPDLEAIDL